MNNKTYTVIIISSLDNYFQNTVKLRDLYGASFLISYLTKSICETAQAKGYNIISPATFDIIQGLPNVIFIEGEFSEIEAESALKKAWKAICRGCRYWIEDNLDLDFCWARDWSLWEKHCFSLFWGQGKTITEAVQFLNQYRHSRNWIGINWQSESSTLSGINAVAWHGMSRGFQPKEINTNKINDEISYFYQNLSHQLGNSIIDEREQLSIPELVRRLITLREVAEKLNLNSEELPDIEIPLSFKDINYQDRDSIANGWTGWFQGDGDKIGSYLKSLSGNESENLNYFSKAMMEWGQNLKYALPKSKSDLNKLDRDGRIIYAGGDNFLGVLYRNDEPKLTAKECLRWLYNFPDFWQKHQQAITLSMGFVWTAPGVPQRDILQHCNEALYLAKNKGRDRIAFRILFSNGNYLEWFCPWWFLQQVLESYHDRDRQKNWLHIYQDVAQLEHRHAFGDNKSVALSLFEIYFGKQQRKILEEEAYLWNDKRCDSIQTGILGERSRYSDEESIDNAISNWVINLAKVGFYLCR